MNNEKFNITANVSDSISYISRQCEIYLCDKYHDFTNSNCFSFLRSVRIQNMSSSDVLDSTLKIEFDAPEIKDSLIHISCLDKDKIVEKPVYKTKEIVKEKIVEKPVIKEVAIPVPPVPEKIKNEADKKTENEKSVNKSFWE